MQLSTSNEYWVRSHSAATHSYCVQTVVVVEIECSRRLRLEEINGAAAALVVYWI